VAELTVHSRALLIPLFFTDTHAEEENDCTIVIMADTKQLHNRKRKRTRERNNITRFANSVNSFTRETSLDDYEHYKGRIEEALERMLRLDDSIQDLLADDE
jgi:hypothetical protein